MLKGIDDDDRYCNRQAFRSLRLSCRVGWSQTAQITGTVTDATGAAVPNAQIIATNTETGVSRSSVTNEAGNYLITRCFLANIG